ncbi:LuxR family transcriptional regulator (plasmid) [Bosea vestrisii]|uniref:LuxR family transcriptional regulator n=1 Tax=Bosea vestrisii TaxID=151416 RepID=UPI0024E006BD|nr:LuxR family transcriptional regulator [Bosea vestrisii]WID99736.1 LuxR family transcriptional regulator [Bosea vestrisii]
MYIIERSPVAGALRHHLYCEMQIPGETMLSDVAIDWDVLEEISDIGDAGGAAGYKEHVNKLLQRYGIDCWLVTALQPVTAADAWQSGIFMNAWPEPWYRRYLAAGHYRHDPCVARSLESRRPFAWQDLSVEVPLHGSAEAVMAEARAFGLKQGVCVPLHAPAGGLAVVTMAGEAIDDAPRTVQILELIALKAFWSLSGLRPIRRPSSEQPPHLSTREREVLQWFAAGKTDWEIGQILGIAHATVTAHRRNMRAKLGTTNIAHTIAEAVRLNLIQL